MKKDSNTLAIIAVVGAVVLLAGGGLAGFIFAKSKTAPAIQKLQNLTSVLNSLSSSRIIVSTIAYGKVKSISGGTIVLNRDSEDLSVVMIEGAQVYLLSSSGSDLSQQKTATLSDIKVGDDVNISLKVLPDGQLQGLSAVIFPQVVVK